MGPHFRRVVHTVRIGLVATLALASIARADGVYIPQRAYPVLPTIPVQRAIIIHRNGVETLIVESAFQTKSPDVAWILPLPAVPSNLQLTEAGAISSTAFSLRPKIVADLHDFVLYPGLVCLLILPFCLAIIFIPSWAGRRGTFMDYLLSVLWLAFIGIFLLPTLGISESAVTSANSPGLSILSTQRLGDADFTVLNAATPDALDQWLTGQGLRPLDAAAKVVVADYIARHWCFVVGTLHNDAADLAVPRPLMVTFPAAVPVFPMKLTALANTTTHVELCIFGPDQAVAPGFQCVIADKFHKNPGPPDAETSTSQPASRATNVTTEWSMTASAYYFAEATGAALGHPDIVPLLWNDCTATKLVADLPPARMDQDITIQFQPLKPQRQEFFTSSSTVQAASGAMLAGFTVFLILAAVFLRGCRKPGPLQFRILIGCVSGVFIIVPVAAWLLVPTVPVYAGVRLPWDWQWQMQRAGAELVSEGLLWQNMTPEQVAAVFKAEAGSGYRADLYRQNAYTGQPIRGEWSPGNIAVRTFGDETYFCNYDENGIEWRTRITSEATTHATTQPG